MSAQMSHHLVEIGPARGFRGLDIDKFLNDPDFILGGVGAQQLELRVDRESLPVLLLRGYSRIEYGPSGGRRLG
jgi:hypothetical protein